MAADDQPSLEELKAVFPQLEIVGLIGRGGMGWVFKARQPHLDRFVALKLLPKASAGDPLFSERFNREARVLARLSHPNIVAVYDFGVADGFHYLLMEYVDGLNLRQAMQAGRFSPAEALAIVPRICEALQFAHEQGVLHRDIKPENILLDARGRVKIADFGIAKWLREDKPSVTLTATGTALGSPHYMAPEQLEKPEQVDHRADIYSLGVVFYEMLTGELPIGRFSPPSERVSLDQRVDDIVLRALAREKELRQNSAREVKSEVENVTSGERPAAGRGKLHLAWAALVAVVVLGAVFWRFPARPTASGPAPRTNAPPQSGPVSDQALIDQARQWLAQIEGKVQAGEATAHDLAKARMNLSAAEARKDPVLQNKAYLSYAEELLAIATERNDAKAIAAARYEIVKARFAVAAAEARGNKGLVAKAQAEAARANLELTRSNLNAGLAGELQVRSAEREVKEALQYLEAMGKADARR